MFSDQKLHRIIKEYVIYFNRARPHQGIAQKIMEESGREPPPAANGKIVAFPVPNGLYHDYRRAA
jgi:putative transposase